VKVLVTGALGNVGLYTVDALLEEGHDVVSFDLTSPRMRKLASRLGPRVRVAWGNITDRASLGAALEGASAAVHLAAILPPKANQLPDLARRVNVEATRSLIELMEASPTARRLVFASSQGVFGYLQDREPPLRVDTPVSPTDEYGRHKVACEQAIRASRLKWSILRLGVAVPTRLRGYPQDPRSGFEISAGARVEFLHPGDAGTAFARAVACDEAIGKILYIGGGEKCQMRNLEFFNQLMDGIGIGPGDWLDTAESQRLLRYQRRGLAELKADMRKDLGAAAPLIRLLRPVVTWFLLRGSPYLKENRRARPA
jgi:nucleoside-diphosphate-sugar epimerase